MERRHAYSTNPVQHNANVCIFNAADHHDAALACKSRMLASPEHSNAGFL
jgi:hypothetical protein